MTPSPIAKHQIVSSNLFLILQSFVAKHRLGRVFYAPFDVILSDYDVVEPDILFVRGERVKVIIKEWVRGAPDRVIEILSRTTEEIDRGLKMKLYEKYGVREYRIVDPDSETIEIYVLRKSHYKLSSRVKGGKHATSEVLAGLEFQAAEAFKAD